MISAIYITLRNNLTNVLFLLNEFFRKTGLVGYTLLIIRRWRMATGGDPVIGMADHDSSRVSSHDMGLTLRMPCHFSYPTRVKITDSTNADLLVF